MWVYSRLLEWKWACSYWTLIPLLLTPERPQCLSTMVRVFCIFLPVFPKGNSFQIPFPLRSLKENGILVHTVVSCNLRSLMSLMWSLANLKDRGGNILTMLVIILQNTWILNTVVFQYKWWLFLFMSLIWFCSCNTVTWFCEEGEWFLYKNVSQCVIFEKWREGVWGDWKKLIKKA